MINQLKTLVHIKSLVSTHCRRISQTCNTNPSGSTCSFILRLGHIPGRNNFPPHTYSGPIQPPFEMVGGNPNVISLPYSRNNVPRWLHSYCNFLGSWKRRNSPWRPGCGDMDLGPSGEWAVELPESTSILWKRSESGELSSSVEAEASSALGLQE